MKKDTNYLNGNSNVYVFPDDEGYKKYVLDKLHIPLNSQIEIKDQEGKPYSMEDPSRND